MSASSPPQHESQDGQTAAPDLHIFSDDNLRAQLGDAKQHLGYKVLRFYVDAKGLISKQATDQTATFYFLPSGGTLRDKDFNLVTYKARFDLYKGMGRS